MGLPSISWEGVDKYDGPWQGKLFIKWVCHLFPGRVWTNTMGLGRGKKVYKMGLPAFPWEGVHKYDGHGEVL